MALITNKNNLPEAIIRAIKNDSYHKGDAAYSCTELLKPARQRALQNKYYDQLEEDASDRIWSLFGQLGHLLIERAGGDDLQEQRFYARFGSYTVSAQVDNLSLENDILSDFKFTTVWKFKENKAPDPDYIAQLNIQAEILRQNGYTPDNLQIIAILRDWSKNQARNNDDYPKSQVIVQEIPHWPSAKTKAFIEMRIAAHEMAKDDLPDCESHEMWEKDTTYAVMKKGKKYAVKLFSTLESAAQFIADDPLLDVQVRPGERIRCNSYCSVNKFCEQYQTYLKEKI